MTQVPGDELRVEVRVHKKQVPLGRFYYTPKLVKIVEDLTMCDRYAEWTDRFHSQGVACLLQQGQGTPEPVTPRWWGQALQLHLAVHYFGGATEVPCADYRRKPTEPRDVAVRAFHNRGEWRRVSQ